MKRVGVVFALLGLILLLALAWATMSLEPRMAYGFSVGHVLILIAAPIGIELTLAAPERVTRRHMAIAWAIVLAVIAWLLFLGVFITL